MPSTARQVPDGADRFIGTPQAGARDIVWGDAGDDGLNNRGTDEMQGSAGNDPIIEGTGINEIYGEGGDDFLRVDLESESEASGLAPQTRLTVGPATTRPLAQTKI